MTRVAALHFTEPSAFGPSDVVDKSQIKIVVLYVTEASSLMSVHVLVHGADCEMKIY